MLIRLKMDLKGCKISQKGLKRKKSVVVFDGFPTIKNRGILNIILYKEDGNDATCDANNKHKVKQ